jgi:hypothetical protein
MTASTTPPRIEAQGDFPRDPRLFVRDHARFLRESLREAMAEHHERHIPRHFQPFAIAKYGYKPRSNGYERRKRRLGKHNPLEFTGRTKTQVTTSRQITATQHRATLIMRLPLSGGTGRFRLAKGQTQLSSSQRTILQIIEELRAIAPDEVTHLRDFVAARYAARANEPGVRYRVRGLTRR